VARGAWSEGAISAQAESAHAYDLDVARLSQEANRQDGVGSSRRPGLHELRSIGPEGAPYSRNGAHDAGDLVASLQRAQRRCSDLEGELVDFQLRHRRMDEEVLRAEAQIDLIKDILFGESRL
jgi:hypothetical protein